MSVYRHVCLDSGCIPVVAYSFIEVVAGLAYVYFFAEIALNSINDVFGCVQNL